MKIHIIGGGIVGLSAAWFLNESGYEVCVVDETDLMDGTSHGNAGMIVPSHFIPMASPGVVAQGIKWMFSAKSPFFIKPRLNTALIRWLWTFYHSCYAEHTVRSAPILFDFHEWSKSIYATFSALDNFDFCFDQKGLLMLYKTAKKEKEEHEVAAMANDIGIDVEILNEIGLSRLEPKIKIEARGGVYFPGDAHLYPNQFMSNLFQALKEKGVMFILKDKVTGLKQAGNQVVKIELASRKQLDVQQVLICAGAWSSKILQKLGVKILLQDGKGYSSTMVNPTHKPKIPTILSEAKVAVTPMGQDLRIGGTLEISNFSKKIHKRRFEAIVESMPKYYPQIQVNQIPTRDIWIGYRPCSPDGMPFIGKCNSIENLSVATGHGMMGMSLGPATGKLITEILTGAKPTIPTSHFNLNRF